MVHRLGCGAMVNNKHANLAVSLDYDVITTLLAVDALALVRWSSVSFIQLQ